MLKRIGAMVEQVTLPFQPESGAYGGGHKHGHDETFAEDYALAQQVFGEHHGHEHDHEHAHEHGHDHGHDHGHAHEHGHGTCTMADHGTLTRTTTATARSRPCDHDPRPRPLTSMRIAELTALLHLASPALPIGAFSYSQGLEAAIEAQLDHRRRQRPRLDRQRPRPTCSRAANCRSSRIRSNAGARMTQRASHSPTANSSRAASPRNCAAKRSRWAGRCGNCASRSNGATPTDAPRSPP